MLLKYAKSNEIDPITRLIHRLSSWTDLKRAVAWILKVQRTLLHHSRKGKQDGTHAQLHPNNTHQDNLQ